MSARWRLTTQPLPQAKRHILLCASLACIVTTKLLPIGFRSQLLVPAPIDLVLCRWTRW